VPRGRPATINFGVVLDEREAELRHVLDPRAYKHSPAATMRNIRPAGKPAPTAYEFRTFRSQGDLFKTL
jgi:hypothetical protein